MTAGLAPRVDATPYLAKDPDDLISTFVRPEMHVHLAATPSRPNALQAALARVCAGRRSLTVSTTAIHSSAHALALSGAVSKVITGFLGDTYPTPRPNPLYRDLALGEPFQVELWSLLTYTQRLMAGALGQPFATTGSRIADTDLGLGKGDAVNVVPHPDGSDRVVTLLAPMTPDVALYHGVCADRRGNVVACGPLGEGAWAAFAARQGVLASVEKIVDDEVIDQIADRVIIPAHRVIGLCEAPMGAHPQSLRTNNLAGVEGYLDDYEHLTEIVEACRTPQGARRWFDEWVGGLAGHDDYLTKLDERHTRDRVRLSRQNLAAPPAAPTTTDPATAPTNQEQLIILGARAVVALVEDRGYDTLLAGIGTSHVSAWLAARILTGRGRSVNVAAELGFMGMDPGDGDVFLFSQRHADSSTMLTSIPEILGGAVAANSRCLGVLSAAEVDSAGNLNTTLLPDGRWITGSGGANDIASTTDCIVIATASQRRYVDRVAHLTSPGERVRDVVSQFGWFRRPDDQTAFRLATWLVPPIGQVEKPQEAIRDLTTWTSDTSQAAAEEPISTAELDELRRIDPEGHYR
jgi:acyl CoA:acetate/3-ketoacid CoA transferase alpha subunit/acyl CoA:acetate/3-ketoacid CoA transferase beta subunit